MSMSCIQLTTSCAPPIQERMRTVKDTASCQHLFYVALAAAYPQSTSDKRRTRWWFKKKENLLFELHLTILKLPKRPLRRTHRIPHWPIARLDHNIHSTAAHSAAVNLPSAMSLLISKTLDSIPPFKHTPLDHTQPSIRIMKVLPDLSPEGSVQCTLTHGTTDDDYTCLSYTWGDENTTCPALMNGQLFFVRQNLHNFMHVVRRLYPLRPFWIDAVCIDQGTVAERNHQVAQMGAIYTAAAHVLVWLGSSSNIAEFFRSWNRIFQAGGSWHWWWMSVQDSRKGAGAGWVEFANHPYWTRAWITQEIAHSRTLSFLADVVEVHDLRNIAQSPWIGAPEGDERFRTHVNIALRDYTEPILGDSLLSLLQRLPNQESGNPRDRFYSLLGLAADSADTCVDYGSSELEFVQMLLKHFKQFEKLSCLCGLTIITNILSGVETLTAGASAEVDFFRVIAPSDSVYIFSQSEPMGQQSKHRFLTTRDEVFSFKLGYECSKEFGNCSLEIIDCGENGESGHIGRFARQLQSEFRICREGKDCSFVDCPCEEELWWSGRDSHLQRGVYYDFRLGTWQPVIETTRQQTLIWYKQPNSPRLVSNWFRVGFQSYVVAPKGYYVLDIPMRVIWSYTQQSKAFPGLEAYFVSSESSLLRLIQGILRRFRGLKVATLPL